MAARFPEGWTDEDEEDYRIAMGESGGRVASRSQVMRSRQESLARQNTWSGWFDSLPMGAQIHYNNGGGEFKAAIKSGPDAMQTVALLGPWREDELANYRLNPFYPYRQPTRFGGLGTIVEHASYTYQHKPEDAKIVFVNRAGIIGPSGSFSLEDAELLRRTWPDEWMRILADASLDELRRRVARAQGAGYTAETPAAPTGPATILGDIAAVFIETVDAFRRSRGDTRKANAQHILNAIQAHPSLALDLAPAVLKEAKREAGMSHGDPRAGFCVLRHGSTAKHPVNDIADAQRRWNDYRDRSGAGASEIGNGVTVYDSAGKALARISYNGRIWYPGDRGFDEEVASRLAHAQSHARPAPGAESPADRYARAHREYEIARKGYHAKVLGDAEFLAKQKAMKDALAELEATEKMALGQYPDLTSLRAALRANGWENRSVIAPDWQGPAFLAQKGQYAAVIKEWDGRKWMPREEWARAGVSAAEPATPRGKARCSVCGKVGSTSMLAKHEAGCKRGKCPHGKAQGTLFDDPRPAEKR